ncbi:hypothetical protein T484DRAFT_3425945 [Baffinella frigidus]|nr:hypothetical protein T484DRAFT_3425945 [Cryptophyta sp. CCMP2293]
MMAMASARRSIGASAAAILLLAIALSPAAGLPMNPYSPRVRLSLAEVLHNVNDLQSRSPVVETPLRGGFGSPPPGAGGYHPGNLRFSSPGLSPAYPPSGGPATPKKHRPTARRIPSPRSTFSTST